MTSDMSRRSLLCAGLAASGLALTGRPAQALTEARARALVDQADRCRAQGAFNRVPD